MPLSAGPAPSEMGSDVVRSSQAQPPTAARTNAGHASGRRDRIRSSTSNSAISAGLAFAGACGHVGSFERGAQSDPARSGEDRSGFGDAPLADGSGARAQRPQRGFAAFEEDELAAGGAGSEGLGVGGRGLIGCCMCRLCAHGSSMTGGYDRNPRSRALGTSRIESPGHFSRSDRADRGSAAAQRRRSLRHISLRPDHTSSFAQTFTSTSPWGSTTARTTSSVTSVGTFDAPPRPTWPGRARSLARQG